MFPDNLTVYDLAQEDQKLKNELDKLKDNSTNIQKSLEKSALYLRSTIKDNDDNSPWPFMPSALQKSIHISTDLRAFLCAILTGEMHPKYPSKRSILLVESFAQDFIYAVSCGPQVPPKHMVFPCVLKALTGNSELIQILNRLGHAVSYSTIEENQTALCLLKLAAATDAVVLPDNIKPHVFTTLAWDNIDRLEETLTGGGTSHRVNGIAVQPKLFGLEPLKPPVPIIPKNKSFSLEELPLPVHISGERIGPVNVHTVNRADVIKEVHNKNIVWFLTRQVKHSDQAVMGWTGFNITVRKDIPVSQDNIGYLPTINAPATNMSTVYEILNQSIQIRNTLKLHKIVFAFDQALYAKATEIVWKKTEKFKYIILRMGVFHTICNLLSIIGKRFQDGGLKDIIIEAGLVAEGSISGVMESRKYNRGVRAHKCMYEALLRIAFKEFIPWMYDNHSSDLQLIEDGLIVIQDLQENIDQETYEKCLDNEQLGVLLRYFTEFLDHLRNNNGALSAFWMTYLDLVNILLGRVRASREGNWEMHMGYIHATIPWCFSYNKINYARYLSVYYAEMSQLPEKHPDIYQSFQEGGFSVQIGRCNTFGRIPVDQTTEETVNKNTKTPGGTCRFSLNTSAITRYYLTAEYRSTYIRMLRESLNLKQAGIQHADLNKPRIMKDDKAVCTVVDVINDLVNLISLTYVMPR